MLGPLGILGSTLDPPIDGNYHIHSLAGFLQQERYFGDLQGHVFPGGPPSYIEYRDYKGILGKDPRRAVLINSLFPVTAWLPVVTCQS